MDGQLSALIEPLATSIYHMIVRPSVYRVRPVHARPCRVHPIAFPSEKAHIEAKKWRKMTTSNNKTRKMTGRPFAHPPIRTYVRECRHWGTKCRK